MKHPFYVCVLAIGLLSSFQAPAVAKKFAAVGVPITQTRSTIDSAFSVSMDNNQKVSNRLVIVEDEGKYYWETRDHHELIFTQTRQFDLFLDQKTGGYIKIIKQNDGSYAYLEHISFTDFKAFTYWGVLNVYQP